MVAIETAERITNSYFLSFLPTVNSPPVSHRDINGSSTSYRPYNEEYASVHRQIDRPVQVEMDTERSKKDKKWSIGKLFRRKKKEEDTASSSQSDEGVSGKSPTKKKSKKKKRPQAVNNFDHIVIRDTRRAQSLAKPHYRELPDDGILSDPSAGFFNYKSKIHEVYDSKDYLDTKNDAHLGTLILETPSKKKRKSRLKARVEALRNSIRGESSSDEESLKSSNSSSIIRFRSEDSLMRSRDSSLNKKSRNARNERYIKRLSRDEENQLNKEAELLQQGYTKAEVEMLTRTPTSQSSGYGTCKRENTNNIKSDQLTVNDLKRVPLKSDSVSSFPSTQSYLSSINFNAKVNNEHINYSIKCPDNKFNKESHYTNSNKDSNQYESPENIMCVKFPLGNITHINKQEKSPPIPPPRDMQRKVTTPISMSYDNNSLPTDRITNHQNATHGVPNNDFERIMRRSQERSIGHNVLNGLRRPISNSEDHIAMQSNEYLQYYLTKPDQPRRPASVSAEPNYYGIFSNNIPWRKKVDDPNMIKPEPVQLRQDYLYYADQSPRSRRPISIKSSQIGFPNQYVNDYQISSSAVDTNKRPKNASEFWKKIDDAERQRRQNNKFVHSRSNSESTCTMETYKALPDQNRLHNKGIQNRAESVDGYNRNKSFDIIDDAKMWKATTEYKRSSTIEPTKNMTSPTKTHVRHKSDTFVPSTYQMPSDDEKSSERRKSTNLDDALNELEAIYNSLGLGDEDLLDRAERRELMTPKFNDHFNDWNGNDDDIQLRSQPSTPLRRINRRSTLPDKLQDDMAFRRMNSFSKKEKPSVNETQSQISYMLASPIYVPYASDEDKISERNEPDIVFDDVVYRNIKQTNNRLKTMEPQPPFGIPVGPISPAPQSDYLHAIPENKGRSRFVPKRSPDIVADDLAYRSLRKDNRHSSSFNADDYSGYVNNNSYNEYPQIKESIANIKKKRAIRSLSANIFSMIQKDIDEAINMSRPTLQKTNSNSDVMKRLRETFENNDNNIRDHHPRNKVNRRHNTVNLFVNNTHASSHHFTKDDSFIHNDDTCFAKMSSCDKSKSSSPSNKSPQISKRSSKDEFQHVLSMLAQEAMDTSNKLGVALAELDKNRNKSDTPELHNKVDDSKNTILNGGEEPSINNNKPDINKPTISPIEVESCRQLNCYDKVLTVNDTEKSLYVISDQLHMAEDELKYSFDKETKVEGENNIFSNLTKSEKELIPSKANSFCNTINSDNFVRSEPMNGHFNNIECIKSIEYKPETPQIKNNHLNPFLNNDDTVKELNEIKAFKELKDGISDLIAGISEVNDKLFLNKKTVNTADIVPVIAEADFTRASEKLTEVTQRETKSQIPKRTSANLSIYENNFEPKKDGADSTEYNSSEELATIFKFDNNIKSVEVELKKSADKHPREDLNSPKLVQTISQNLRRHSVDEGNSSQNNTLPNNVVPWRAKRHNHNSQNDSKGDSEKSKHNWHDSGSLMLACSYTLTFSQHLADLDWLTLLGLLLAIITIIAMLMI